MNKYNEFPSLQIVMDDHYTTLIPIKGLFTEFSIYITTYTLIQGMAKVM